MSGINHLDWFRFFNGFFHGTDLCQARLSMNLAAAKVALVNGQPAITVTGTHTQRMVLAIGFNNEYRISWIYIMRNPDKLNQLGSDLADA